MMFVIGLVDSRDFYFFWVGVFGILRKEFFQTSLGYGILFTSVPYGEILVYFSIGRFIW